jgi:hypothetical protein
MPAPEQVEYGRRSNVRCKNSEPSCLLWVNRVRDDRDDAVAHVHFFAPKADKQQIVSLCPLSADFVAEVCDCGSKAASSTSRNGSHHPLFAER